MADHYNVNHIALGVYVAMGGIPKNWLKEAAVVREEYREFARKTIETARESGVWPPATEGEV